MPGFMPLDAGRARCRWLKDMDGQDARRERAFRAFAPHDAIGVRANRKGLLHPHWHQNVERALGILVLHQCRRPRIGELQHRDLALDLRRDIEQIA